MSGRKILIVDDNADSARMLEALLAMLGHEARCAFTGVSAVEAALEFCPDLMLLDLSLPDIDGFEVARRLRGSAGLEKMVLVAATGWSEPEVSRRARTEGFARLLVKPIDIGKLEEVLLLCR